MIPFTVSGLNWYEAEKLEELRQAYSERISIAEFWGYQVHDGFAKSAGVIEPAVYDIPDTSYEGSDVVYFGGFRKFTGSSWKPGDGTAADSLQVGTTNHAQYRYLWQEIQQFCSGFGLVFYDSSRRLSPINYFLAKNFFQKVGGNLYQDENNWGFRRVSSLDEFGAPVFQRGNARVGDFLGPWIIDDLKACFAKMTGFTVYRGGTRINDNSYAFFSVGGPRPEELTVLSEGINGISISGATVYTKYVDGTEVFNDYPVGISAVSFPEDMETIEDIQTIAHFNFQYGTLSA